MGVELAGGLHGAEVEALCDLFDGDQAALDEGAEGGFGDLEGAEVADAHAATDGGELGEDGGLVVVELWNPRVGDEDGDALEAAGIALLGHGLAEEPFFADHAFEQGLVGGGGGAEGRGLGGGTVFEVVEDGVLAVLVLRRETGAAGGALLRAFVEDAAAGLGDAVGDVALDLGGEGEHTAQDLAERSDVVLSDPGGEAHELVGEERRFVEDLLDGLDLDRLLVGTEGSLIVDADDDAHEALAAERDQDTRTHGRNLAVHRVGEGLVERDGQGYVAEGGHRSW